MAILAEQLMNGMSRMVRRRSCEDGRVRVAITPGTEHPKPMSIGTMLRPERPRRRSSLSETNAMRAMYPLSSSIDRKKNSTMMMGTKLSTEPTPPKMPSTTSERTGSLTSQRTKASSTTPPSQSMPAASKSCSHRPMTSNVSQKTSAMMAMKAGMAVHLPVRVRSILRLRRYSLLSLGLDTVCAHRRPMKEKRMSAMAAWRSRPRSSSIWTMMCSTISFSFCSRPIAITKIAQKTFSVYHGT